MKKKTCLLYHNKLLVIITFDFIIEEWVEIKAIILQLYKSSAQYLRNNFTPL